MALAGSELAGKAALTFKSEARTTAQSEIYNPSEIIGSENESENSLLSILTIEKFSIVEVSWKCPSKLRTFILFFSIWPQEKP